MTDLSHVMRIDFKGYYGEEKVALFNINRISEDEVREHLMELGVDIYHPEILIMNPEQFDHIFLNK